ncbi:MAG: thiamine pyrophosphate-dependent enzyme [Sandaracinaceae bacterium]|nr:thiamine pyrophosphate-dependent enzyme [Sandaracinaceae bacterium]
MQRQGEGYFWIGGPGEEAFNTVLGLLVKKGQGLDHDYLHLHYRSSATLLAMGAPSIDALRQMHNTATDPYSRGRNFVGHFSKRAWNVAPVSSPIEVQYSIAIGTGLAQRRHGGTGITIVQGGDAGTAEGDFATCLVWASRPGCELPMLIVVTNNQWGISTAASTQHGEEHISDRGKPFGMRTAVCDGNDPEAAWAALEEAMEYVRTERKPFVLEALVSRLYGHSSSSGSNYVSEELDCVIELEKKLDARGVALARGEQAPARGARGEDAGLVQAGADRAEARGARDLGPRLRGSQLRRRGRAEPWRRWCKRCAWRSTSAKRSSA